MADERRAKAIEVSPEEERFLHRFVRRTMFPWIAGVGALAGLALGVALSPPPPAVLGALEPGVAHASAAQDELRAEVAKLRDELTALRSGAGPKARAGDGDLASIRDRLSNLEVRQDRKEQEHAALPQDVVARLYDLERSVQSEAAARVGNLETGEQRIQRLELRLSTLEGLSSAPASPAPSQ